MLITPTIAKLPVSSNASQPRAIICIDIPMKEPSIENHSRRNFRLFKETKAFLNDGLALPAMPGPPMPGPPMPGPPNATAAANQSCAARDATSRESRCVRPPV